MSFMFTVSPDFTPDHLSGWYIFNTWLQKQTNLGIHLKMYLSFQDQRKAVKDNIIDLIYANPYGAAMLIREKGFQPLVKAAGRSDEAIIAVRADNPIEDVADLAKGIKVAFSEDPEVYLMGMLMLEPGDLNKENITPLASDSYIVVAKQLLKKNADVGIFLAEAYDDFSPFIKKQLKILVRSQIDLIHHSLLIGPKLLDKKEVFQQALLEMSHNEAGLGVLNSLSFKEWEKVDDDEMEFMIDLIDTLTT